MLAPSADHLEPQEPQGKAPEETAFWASSACAGQLPRSESSKPRSPEPGSCVLVGPPNSGKTSFLASLGRAFEQERPPEWTRFVAGSKLARLIDASSTIPDASREEPPWETYSFQIGMRTAEEMEVSVLDTPGSFFESLAGEGSGETDRKWVVELVRAIRNARCLVLCIDAGDERLEQNVRLAGVINQLLGLGSRRVQRVGAKSWPTQQSPWERTPRLELPFDRVLVLLTGIETLCTEVARRLEWVQTEWIGTPPTEIRNLAVYRGLSAWDVAELLELGLQAEKRVQDLDLLAASLKPDSRLAVCGISTAGLKRDRPEETSSIFEVEDPDPLIAAPFGIWQSLLFMTTGQVVAPLTIMEQGQRLAKSHRWSRLTATSGYQI